MTLRVGLTSCKTVVGPLTLPDISLYHEWNTNENEHNFP